MQKGRRILLLILVPPVLLFGFALILMWLPLPQPFPAPLSHGRNLVVAVATGILGIGYSELGLGNLQAFTEETAWTRGLLAEPTNRATVSRLMRDQKRYGLREVYIQPERIWLRAHPSSQVTGGQIGQWFEEGNQWETSSHTKG